MLFVKPPKDLSNCGEHVYLLNAITLQQLSFLKDCCFGVLMYMVKCYSFVLRFFGKQHQGNYHIAVN